MFLNNSFVFKVSKERPSKLLKWIISGFMFFINTTNNLAICLSFKYFFNFSMIALLVQLQENLLSHSNPPQE